MPQEKIKRIHLIYGCIAAVLIIALGIALMLSCLDIYNSAPSRPYSAAAIAQRFDKIALLVYAVIAIIVGGFVLDLALPVGRQRPKARRDEVEAMNRLKSKAGTLDGDPLAAARKEQRTRKTYKWVTAGLCAALAVYPVIYYSDWSHFPIQGLNAGIVRAALVVLIPTAVCLLLCFGCSLLCSKSIARETAVYKAAIAAGPGSPLPVEAKASKALPIARIAVLAAALLFIGLGLFNGGVQDVLTKAIAICTECIGLG